MEFEICKLTFETVLKIFKVLGHETFTNKIQWQNVSIVLRTSFSHLSLPLYNRFHYRAFFNHILRAVSAHSALFEKWNTLFSTKNSKNTCHLGGYSVLNALNLEELGVNIYNCALLLDFLALFWLNHTHALIF